MTRQWFGDGWSVRPRVALMSQLSGSSPQPQPVTLPHDALIGGTRTSDGEGKTAYFPASTAFEYSRTFVVPEAYRDKRVTLEFQGAYRDAVVFVNDAFAAQRPNGYSTFRVPLDDFLVYGGENTVRVEVRAHDDSRWYSGNGITRDVFLVVHELVHLAADGVVVTTPDVDDERAVVDAAVRIVNDDRTTRTATVMVELTDAAGDVVASDSAPVTLRGGNEEVSRRRLYLPQPRRWSAEDPYLYTVTVRLQDADDLDSISFPWGVRTLQLDPIHGLRVNGVSVKLRGACVHHDNGPLGGAAPRRAEERRIELLKDSGFNAVRSAHNPLSQAMLAACDRLGMFVMDEAFDMWTDGKASFDYSLDFPEWWERDIEAMVAKDRNHPCVIMYSIGNEIGETGQPLGAQWGRRLAEKVRECDPTRYVTNGVNAMISVLRDLMPLIQEQASAMPAGGLNDAMAAAGDMMRQVSASELVTDRTAESFSVLDVAGINYGESRYELDRTLFPRRIIVGTETFPGNIDVNWSLVQANPAVLGDFTWTGWDYLGEVGLGRTRYTDEQAAFEAPFPWLVAGCGDLDITGYRRPISYYREIVFGRRSEPYLSVHRPEVHGRPVSTGGWAWSESVSSWTWSVPAGTPTTVEVYAPVDGDVVQLLVNGNPVGRRSVGSERAFLARFDDVEYHPGDLTAVLYRNGTEVGRTALQTAGPALLHVTSDRTEVTAEPGDLAFFAIELRDERGNLDTSKDRRIEVTSVAGGQLLALASARPATEEGFAGPQHHTFDGRALAIVRPDGAGPIVLSVSAEGLPATRVELPVVGAAVAEAFV